MMHITRCIKSGLSAFSRTPQIVQQRTFSALSSMPIRPTLLPTRSLLPASEVASSIVQPTSQTGLSILQIEDEDRENDFEEEESEGEEYIESLRRVLEMLRKWA
ncbi:unnamed protein product [Zymoseptoria tritici ST99CH_3D7]|uniref:Uncharacterized protein n=1 Tax=Zymoseptoria tritici (strain ST99CH_3D7) TaxID=1276538 RepID=A0A1X7RYY4_ZYMT9|nr:unnamed protein product [Zymoseptoria tritici ST99CH_3D7]